MDHAELIHLLAGAIEAGGVLVITLGLLRAAWRARMHAATERYLRAREDIGRAVLLGLEVLVAADIVRTVALEPTPRGLALLALIIAIRTFLSWSLALELDGRWPWQRPARVHTPAARLAGERAPVAAAAASATFAGRPAPPEVHAPR